MKYIIPFIFLPIIAIFFMSCGENSENNKASRVECKVDKIDILLKDIISKRFFYDDIKPVGKDNILYRNIIEIKNIPIRESVFY